MNAGFRIMNLNSRLKIARESLGKSLEDMATSLGIGHRSWCGYEAGSNYPGGKVFESLVKLGFNANWLLTGEGSMKLNEYAGKQGEGGGETRGETGVNVCVPGADTRPGTGAAGAGDAAGSVW